MTTSGSHISAATSDAFIRGETDRRGRYGHASGGAPCGRLAQHPEWGGRECEQKSGRSSVAHREPNPPVQLATALQVAPLFGPRAHVGCNIEPRRYVTGPGTMQHLRVHNRCDLHSLGVSALIYSTSRVALQSTSVPGYDQVQRMLTSGTANASTQIVLLTSSVILSTFDAKRAFLESSPFLHLCTDQCLKRRVFVAEPFSSGALSQ